MKLAVLGATGRSGLCVVRQALAEDHDVIAIVRNPENLRDIKNDKFQVVEGNIFSAASLRSHFEGCDAILSCLGVNDLLHKTTFYSESMKAIVTAMREANVHKIIIITSWYVKIDVADNPGFTANWFIRPILSKILNDMAVMEQYLEEECPDINYIIVRPPQLINAPSQGKDFIIEVNRQFADAPKKISRSDVARFMLQCLKTEEYNQKSVSIGIPK